MATEIKNAITARDFASVVAIKRWMLDDATKDQDMHLGTVIGKAYKTTRKEGRTPDGELTESIVIEGEFEMFKATTGEFKEGSAVFLPRAFSQMVESGLLANNGNPIEFAVEIGARRRGEGDYLYTTRSMIEDRKADRFAALRQKAIGAGARIPPKQLAGPAEAPEARVVGEDELISLGDALGEVMKHAPAEDDLAADVTKVEAEAEHKGKGRHKAA